MNLEARGAEGSTAGASKREALAFLGKKLGWALRACGIFSSGTCTEDVKEVPHSPQNLAVAELAGALQEGHLVLAYPLLVKKTLNAKIIALVKKKKNLHWVALGSLLLSCKRAFINLWFSTSFSANVSCVLDKSTCNSEFFCASPASFFWYCSGTCK